MWWLNKLLIIIMLLQHKWYDTIIAKKYERKSMKDFDLLGAYN